MSPGENYHNLQKVSSSRKRLWWPRTKFAKKESHAERICRRYIQIVQIKFNALAPPGRLFIGRRRG
jgi:hypothetical protein